MEELSGDTLKESESEEERENGSSTINTAAADSLSKSEDLVRIN